MAGVKYKDIETLKSFARSIMISKKCSPNFTAHQDFSITTTPERMGLMEYQQRGKVTRK